MLSRNVTITKPCYLLFLTLSLLCLSGWVYETQAGTWQDNFENPASLADWSGDLASFSIQDGFLHGKSAQPLPPILARSIHVGDDWRDYTVECKVNVHTPNLLVCSKGAILFRHNETDGYIFELHAATQRVEVYRSSGEVLLSVPRDIELEQWYLLRAELQGDKMTFSVDGEQIGELKDQRSLKGAVGLLVEDALLVQFDDFQVTGPDIPDRGQGATAVEVAGKLTTTWGKMKSVK